MKIEETTYAELINNIGNTLDIGRQQTYKAVSNLLVQTYWSIGRYIIEFEQKGKIKAEYGTNLLNRLSKDLSQTHGKGFSRSNLIYIRKFYLYFPIGQAVPDQLGWSHWCELLAIDDQLERDFYLQQILNENWTYRELRRQKKTALFHRYALSRDKQGILLLAKQGMKPELPEDLVREPYVLEFLKIPEDSLYSEKQLENRIIEKLQQFLLELGKGFAYIGRQYRISIANRHYKVDLVFYHCILKCYVLIDLKINEVEHYDIGQMNMYVNYFTHIVNMPDDNPPIGIILTSEKDDIFVEFALGGITNQIFISKYQLYLPDRALLEAKVKAILEDEQNLIEDRDKKETN